jgi:hypothetical protein
LQIQSKATFHINLAALSDAKKRLDNNFGWDLGCRLCDYGMIKNIGENVKQDTQKERIGFVFERTRNQVAKILTEVFIQVNRIWRLHMVHI